jgi:hypothetical protein
MQLHFSFRSSALSSDFFLMRVLELELSNTEELVLASSPARITKPSIKDSC